MPSETHVTGDLPTRDEVVELIRERLSEILEIPGDSIVESNSFAEDLHADSLALIELVEILEEELSERAAGFAIADEDLQDLTTVGSAADYVMAKLS